MEKFVKRVSLLVLLFSSIVIFAQKIIEQPIEKPSEGKSLVYIAKTGAGLLLNFRIYDGDKFLGALSGVNYMVYECQPGEHVFWAVSENRDFVEANLEPNSVYVLNAQGQMGAFIASVNLLPLDPNQFADKRTFYQIVKNLKKQTEFKIDEDKSENIQKGLEKYNNLKKSNSKKIRVLEPSWKFENANKPIKEKK